MLCEEESFGDWLCLDYYLTQINAPVSILSPTSKTHLRPIFHQIDSFLSYMDLKQIKEKNISLS